MQASNVNQTVEGNNNIIAGTGDINITYTSSPVTAEERRSLLILLNEVDRIWVKGVFEKSVHRAAQVQLRKKARKDAVESPWGKSIEVLGQPIKELPKEKRIVDVYKEVGQFLLILGKPGSGKTFTLLELASDLIACARDDSSQPVPVVLNLSTWGERRQPLRDWLVNELRTKYRIPKRLARQWLDDNRITFLLDGLDEVDGNTRVGCVEAINRFASDCMTGIVVCSRLQEYLSLNLRLKLNGAIYIQPLTLEQVNTYLNEAGEELYGLHEAISKDGTLQSLSRNPLMLSVMSLAYQGLSSEALTNNAKIDGAESRYEHVFDTYIDRMFERGKVQPNSKSQMKKWLVWLAQGMHQHSESIFLLESLQPSWLSGKKERWLYVLSSRTVMGLLLALSWGGAGSVIAVIGGETEGSFLVIAAAVGIGLVTGLTIALIDSTLLMRIKKSTNRGRLSGVLAFLRITFFYGIIYASLAEILGNWRGGLGFILGTLYGLLLSLLFGSRNINRSFSSDIQTVEGLTLSRNGSIKGIKWSIIVAITILPLIATIYGLTNSSSLISEQSLIEVLRADRNNRKKIANLSDELFRQRFSDDDTTRKYLIQDILHEVIEKSRDDKSIDEGIVKLKGVITMTPAQEAELREVLIELTTQINAAEEKSKLMLAESERQRSNPFEACLLAFKSPYLSPFWIGLLIILLLLGIVLGGVSKKIVDRKSVPNEGIRLTFKNCTIGAIIGATSGLLFVLAIVFVLWFYEVGYGAGRDLSSSLQESLPAVLIVAPFFAGVFCIWYGAPAIFQHYILRLVLYWKGRTPRNYVRFLNDATRLVFLRQVGSGYIFIHRLLLEHFASKKEWLQTEAVKD